MPKGRPSPSNTKQMGAAAQGNRVTLALLLVCHNNIAL